VLERAACSDSGHLLMSAVPKRGCVCVSASNGRGRLRRARFQAWLPYYFWGIDPELSGVELGVVELGVVVVVEFVSDVVVVVFL
jgi:hypothetical protein